MAECIVSSLRVQGFYKKENDLSCEDAFKTRPFPKGQILAVADGHGDPKCIHAERGSRIACEVAAEVLFRFAEKMHRRSPSEYWNESRTEIAEAIVLGFRHAVIDDYFSIHADEGVGDGGAAEREALHALIDKSLERERLVIGGDGEEARRAERERKRTVSKITLLYGTTLRASVLSERYVFSLAVGDGDTVALLEGGERIWLIPKDEAFSTHTESMCEEPADLVGNFYFSFLPLVCGKRKAADSYALRALVLSTDGLRNSFYSDGGYTDFLADVTEKLREKGEKTYARSLRRRLETLTRDSCYGDDITLLIGSFKK